MIIKLLYEDCDALVKVPLTLRTATGAWLYKAHLRRAALNCMQ